MVYLELENELFSYRKRISNFSRIVSDLSVAVLNYLQLLNYLRTDDRSIKEIYFLEGQSLWLKMNKKQNII